MQLRYKIFLAITCLFQLSSLIGQTAIQLSNSPKISLGQWQQPAFLALDNFEQFSLGLGAAYDLGGSSLPMENWPINESFLDEAEKSQILEALDDDNRFNVLAQASLLFNFRSKKQAYSIGFRQRSLAYLQFHNPDLLGLVLLGNAAYEGESVIDENVLLRIQSYSELSFASAATKGNWSYGGRIKLLLGNNHQNLDLRRFDLFTEEFGTAISVAGNFDFDRKRSDQIGGFGAAVDLGAVYQLNEKLSFQASLTDLGFISWSVDKIQNNLNTDYEGVFIEDIRNLDFNENQNIFASDSLERLFFPDTAAVSSSIYTPAFAQAGATYQLGLKSSLGLLFRIGLFPDAPMSNLFQLSGIYQYNFNSWLKGGIHASLGGLEGLEAGAMLAGNIPLGRKQDLKIFCQADKLLGIIQADYGKGQGIQIGIVYQH